MEEEGEINAYYLACGDGQLSRQVSKCEDSGSAVCRDSESCVCYLRLDLHTYRHLRPPWHLILEMSVQDVL